MHAGRDGFDAATMEDPTCDRLRSARRATFRDLWPHDGKRGWQCKTDALVDSGFFFAPTPESEDFVSCAYCKLDLTAGSRGIHVSMSITAVVPNVPSSAFKLVHRNEGKWDAPRRHLACQLNRT